MSMSAARRAVLKSGHRGTAGPSAERSSTARSSGRHAARRGVTGVNVVLGFGALSAKPRCVSRIHSGPLLGFRAGYSELAASEVGRSSRPAGRVAPEARRNRVPCQSPTCRTGSSRRTRGGSMRRHYAGSSFNNTKRRRVRRRRPSYWKNSIRGFSSTKPRRSRFIGSIEPARSSCSVTCLRGTASGETKNARCGCK